MNHRLFRSMTCYRVLNAGKEAHVYATSNAAAFDQYAADNRLDSTVYADAPAPGWGVRYTAPDGTSVLVRPA